ncbi:hypothetical protein ABFT23_02085 [Nocardioides sp. C4-1]|uniref:hypothetical protein n=1 Tax=Nocardioides sp. C4-1 TaxID=3151851 RepID=UPI0032671C34
MTSRHDDKFNLVAHEGAIKYLPRADIEFAEGYEEEVYDLVVNQKRPAAFLARSSIGTSMRGCRAAANDAYELLEWVERTYGMKVLDSAPTIAEMTDALRHHGYEVRSKTRDGTPFTNRYVVFDCLEAGYTITLGVGTVAVEDEDFEPPFPEHVARWLRETTPTPGAIFMKRVDRLARTEFGYIPAYKEMVHIKETTGSLLVADSQLFKWKVGDPDFPKVLSAMCLAGARSAEELKQGRYRAQRRRTGTKMVNGKVYTALPHICPPGFMLYLERKTGP